MDELAGVTYFPSTRAGKYDLLALQEIENERKNKITPIISARGSLKGILDFATKWGDHYFWIDSSRFGQDTEDPIANPANQDTNNFENKFKMFSEIQSKNAKTLPILGFRSGDNQRSVVQLGRKLLDHFPLIGLRLEGADKILEKNIATARAFLNAIDDKDFKRTILIVDLWSTTEMPSLQEEGALQKMLTLLDEYPLNHVVTLSTSWPDTRPERGMGVWAPCIDPLWQAIIHAQLSERGIKCFYGDYAATNPIKDLLDFDPAKMSQPIPFAGYYTATSWYQERQGAGGENEKFRDIARAFQKLPGYHKDNFCWGTRAIAAIASSTRESPGNMAFWNKIRINQHICAMIDDLEGGLLQKIISPQDPDDLVEDDLDDLI